MQSETLFHFVPKITFKRLTFFVSSRNFRLPFRCGYADSVCLICYISTGHLIAYSLPSLRQLMDVDFLPLADLRYIFACSTPITIIVFPPLMFVFVNKKQKNKKLTQLCSFLLLDNCFIFLHKSCLFKHTIFLFR